MSPRPQRKPRKFVSLSPDLEHAILHGIIQGYANPESVAPEELSKPGRVILNVLRDFAAQKIPTPYPAEHLVLAATSLFGGSKEAFTDYLRIIAETQAGQAPAEILRKVRDKQVLLEIINEASEQLSTNSLDVGLLSGLCARESMGTTGKPVSTSLDAGWPDPPKGLPLTSLPRLNEVTGGVHGMWAVAGTPGSGKSTLAWQLTLDIGRHTPVLYYDFENGFSYLMDRTREIYSGNKEKAQAATSRIYYRDNIRTLDYDLSQVPPPALICLDSVQKLPSNVEFRRSGLDRWVHRLELLKHRGYFVLLISEVGRAQYGMDPFIGAYKETGEIEYSADVGLQLIEIGNLVELHIVKNRHRPFKGLVAPLQRRSVKWLWREISNVEAGDEFDL